MLKNNLKYELDWLFFKCHDI